MNEKELGYHTQLLNQNKEQRRVVKRNKAYIKISLVASALVVLIATSGITGPTLKALIENVLSQSGGTVNIKNFIEETEQEKRKNLGDDKYDLDGVELPPKEPEADPNLKGRDL